MNNLKPVILKKKWKNQLSGVTFPKGTILTPVTFRFESGYRVWSYTTPNKSWGETMVNGIPGS